MLKRNLKRFLAFAMAVVMTVGLCAVGVSAVEAEEGDTRLSWEKIDPPEGGSALFENGRSVGMDRQSFYKDTDVVRALIIMDDVSPISAGDTVSASDKLVLEYSKTMTTGQAMTAARISKTVLDGEKLDVVWSFHQLTNAISVNVEYGKLDEIGSVPGVKQVLIERRYELMDEANNMSSQQMTGADGVKSGESGYFGAGTSVAVIDTGLTVDHISFDPAALEYSFRQSADNAGETYEDYVSSLGLLTKETIAAKLNELHVHERAPELTADDLYRNVKVPFAFNYNSGTTDVNHTPGVEGSEHGSHVAGIAAANRYLPASQVYDMDGDKDFDVEDAQEVLDMAVRGEPVKNPVYTDLNNDGQVTAYDAYLLLLAAREGDVEEYVSAAKSVRVDGVAPDAQILAMAVFDANSSTYSSDYIAALEDAITLGADVSNLSLGSPQPAFSGSHGEYDRFSVPDENGAVATIDQWIDGVFEKAQSEGSVVAISAGNSGNWADEDEAYKLMYADEGGVGNLGAPGSFTGAFTVASADNTGFTAMQDTMASNASGDKEIRLRPDDMTGTPAPWGGLDPKGLGTSYEYVFIGDPTALLTGGEQTDMTVYAGNESDFEGYDLAGKIAVVARGNMVNFIDKHQNAAAAGAIAVIVYNNEPGQISGTVAGGDNGDGTVTQPTTAEIPIVGISMEDGLALLTVSDKTDGKFTGDVTVINRATLSDAVGEAKMSYFSSWGATGALAIKPEITAPGGEIMSVNGSDGNTTAYELMSGTSMSSPHLAGLAALGVDYVTADGGKVLSAAKASSGLNINKRALVQSLLMSTAVPLTEHDGIEYSVRNQGAGLANISAAVDAKSFLTVNGDTDGKVKAELGDGTKPFTFTFTVNNLTDDELTYTLRDSIITTGVTTVDGHALTTDEMERLDAKVTYTGATGNTVTVPAGGKTQVTATVAVSDAAAADMKGKGFTNGFYVEGFIYLEGSDVTHSIPLLGWYGDWNDPSMFDTGSTTDIFYGTNSRPSHINSEYKNELAIAPVGSDQGYSYTGNVYNSTMLEEDRDSKYIEDRNSLNTSDPVWELFAVYPTLIRSAKEFNLYITDAETGAEYYRDHVYDNFDRSLFASFYYASQGQWYDVTNDYGIGIEWDGTDPATGEALPEGTKVKITFVCAPEYGAPEAVYDEDGNEIERPDLKEYLDYDSCTLSWVFTVDNTDPGIVEKDGFTLSKDNKLTFTVKDNRYVAAVVVRDGANGTTIDYIFPDMDTEGGEKKMEIDLDTYRTQFGDKVTIAVCDYAGNETYYGVNLNGEGQPYGRFVGFQFDGWGGSKWVSFDADVQKNETSMFACEGAAFTAAEYVGGMVFAQAEDGRLYGIPYEDMLANSVSLEKSYITTLENVYYDFAFNYADGRLYGIYTYQDAYGYGTNVDAIYLSDTIGEDAWGDETEIEAYTVENDIVARQDMLGYTISADDQGKLYVLALTDEETEDEKTELGTTAHLWSFEKQDMGWYTRWNGTDIGDTGITLDNAQSAAWDHNTETLYWSRFIPNGVLSVTSELYKVDVKDAKCERTGVLSDELCGLFAPLSEEAAGRDEHSLAANFDRDEYGTPIFTTTALTMNLGTTAQLGWYFDPWFTNHKSVILESSNPEVASVDKTGLVKALSTGTTTITIKNTERPELMTECQISVASISAKIEGIVSYRGGDSQFYTFNIENGKPTVSYGNKITAHGEFEGYGLQIAASAQHGDTVWADEWGNTGMVYGIDPATGAIKQMFEPIDGDMLFGLAYSEGIDRYTGIMNFYMYADIPLPLSEQDIDDMLKSDYRVGENGERIPDNQFNWHRLDLSPYLNASQGNLVTQEGSEIAKIVLCGVTSMPGQPVSVSGGAFGGVYGSYTPDTTWVLLDNVGRLWYIDELTGATKDQWGGYSFGDEDTYLSSSGELPGILELEYPGKADGESTYNLFVIRELVKTPLYDRFLDGDLGITYNFSDISYAGQIGIPDEGGNGGDGAPSSPMFFFSLYDYWGEGESNELYLYVQNRESQGMDSSWQTIWSEGSLYELGDTGKDYIIATINTSEYISGLDEVNIPVTFHPGTELAELGAKDASIYYSVDGEVTLPYTDLYAPDPGWNVPDSLALDYWTDKDGNKVDADYDLTLEPGLEFTAHWVKTVPVTFNPGKPMEDMGYEAGVMYFSGETFDIPELYELGEEFGWYSMPEGYEFDGWLDKDNKRVEDTRNIPLTEDLEFTISWKEQPTVTIHPGEELKELGHTEDTVVYVTDGHFDLPSEGYELGWYDIPESQELYWQDAKGDEVEETSYIAYVEGMEFTARLRDKPGAICHPGELKDTGAKDAILVSSYGSISLPANTTAMRIRLGWEVPSNYEFKGWQDKTGQTVNEEDYYMDYEEGMEFTALWNVREASSETGLASVEVYDSTIFDFVSAVKGDDNIWRATLSAGADYPEDWGISATPIDENLDWDAVEVTVKGNGNYTITVTAENGATAEHTLLVTIAAD